MNYEITEVIPEPLPEKSIQLTLTTEELGLIVWAMKLTYDQYTGTSECRRLRDELAYIEEISGGFNS